MRIRRSVAEVLAEHVTLEVEGSTVRRCRWNRYEGRGGKDGAVCQTGNTEVKEGEVRTDRIVHRILQGPCCRFAQAFVFCLGWVEGFEPSATGTTIRRSTKLSYTHRDGGTTFSSYQSQAETANPSGFRSPISARPSSTTRRPAF